MLEQKCVGKNGQTAADCLPLGEPPVGAVTHELCDDKHGEREHLQPARAARTHVRQVDAPAHVTVLASLLRLLLDLTQVQLSIKTHTTVNQTRRAVNQALSISTIFQSSSLAANHNDI